MSGAPWFGGFALVLAVSLAAAVGVGVAWASADREPGGVEMREVEPPPGAQPSSAPKMAPRAGAALPTARPAEEPQSRSTAKGSSAPTSGAAWTDVLERLDAARSRALALGDPTLLSQVYAPGSPAAERDGALLRRLVEEGLRADGVRLEVVSVRPVGPDASSGGSPLADVSLRVADRMRGYAVRGVDGRLVEKRPGRGVERFTVSLTWTDHGWRIWDVRRA